MDRLEVASTLFELVRRYNRKSRFSGRAFGTGLTPTESHILIELDAHPEASLMQLAQGLRMEKSTLSRSLQGLVKKGILKQRSRGAGAASKKAAQSASYTYTPKGRQVLEKLDQSANQHISQFVQNLNPEELMTFRGYMKFLMDRDGAPAVTHRRGELPILVEMRRASRVWGFIGRSFLGFDISAASWQLLSEIGQAGGECAPQFLAKQFALSPTTISLNLARLERDKMLTRRSGKKDKRRVELRLTEGAEELLREINSVGAGRIASALEPLKDSELSEFVRLFGKYTEEEVDAELRLSERAGMLRRLESDQDRQRARAFLVEQLVLRGLHHTIPAEILGDMNIALCYEVNGIIRGVAELKASGDDWLLRQYLVDHQGGGEGDDVSFLEEIKWACKKDLGSSALLIPRDSLASQAGHALGGVQSGDMLKLFF